MTEPTRTSAPKPGLVPALIVEELVAGIGPLTILQGISLEVGVNEVAVVLGANGAGKTTLLRAIAGLLPPRKGRIRLFGDPLEGLAPHLVARAGLGHVPSGRELFPRLSVGDHLDLGGRLCAPARRAELKQRLLTMFPVWPSGCASPPERFLAASSRWWRLPVP